MHEGPSIQGIISLAVYGSRVKVTRKVGIIFGMPGSVCYVDWMLRRSPTMVAQADRYGSVRSLWAVPSLAKRIMGHAGWISDGTEAIVISVPAKGRGSFVRMEGMHVLLVLIGLTIIIRIQGTRCVATAIPRLTATTFQVQVAQSLTY